jgi:hypothetical protein
MPTAGSECGYLSPALLFRRYLASGTLAPPGYAQPRAGSGKSARIQVDTDDIEEPIYASPRLAVRQAV